MSVSSVLNVLHVSRKKILIGLALFCLIFPGPAAAETKRKVTYPYTWVFNTAVRLLKIDLKCEVDEKNKESGYITFFYEYKKMKSYATMELVDSTNDDNGYRVIVRVVMDKFPSWVEVDVIDKLEEKIRDLYGSPPEYVKKKADPEKEKDDDGDKDEDDGGDSDKSDKKEKKD
ncbi:MAG: hypothetical protein ABIJ56_03065 [Pseudomonadota bacterium]